MDVKIKYQDIIDRCEKLSSFESEGKFDANGKSRYLELHINKVDEQLIREYAVQAKGILEERMERMISNVEDFVTETATEKEVETIVDGFTWTIRQDTRWDKSKSFIKHINEAIAAYTMASWLRGKLDDRVPFYEALYNNMLALAVKNVFTKQAPKK